MRGGEHRLVTTQHAHGSTESELLELLALYWTWCVNHARSEILNGTSLLMGMVRLQVRREREREGEPRESERERERASEREKQRERERDERREGGGLPASSTICKKLQNLQSHHGERISLIDAA